MNIRFLQREEIPLIWQIDRREIVQNIYFLESKIIGSRQDTLQLKFLHVSRDYRKRGIASMLFKLALRKLKNLEPRNFIFLRHPLSIPSTIIGSLAACSRQRSTLSNLHWNLRIFTLRM